MLRSSNLSLGQRSRCHACTQGLWLMAIAGLGLSGCHHQRLPPSPTLPTHQATADLTEVPQSRVAAALPPVTHRTYELPTSVVQVVTVSPGSDNAVAVVLSDELAKLAHLAEANGAIAAINAGFFDPQNGLTTSYVTVDGAIAADPRQNPRLMDNPDLQTYLPAILNRSELRIYRCDDGVQYDVTVHAAAVPANCTIEGAVGAGPQLLPTLTGDEEGFLADNERGETVRDALGSQRPNARSAVGLMADGTVVFAIATQLHNVDVATGLTLPEMADFLNRLGVQKALNLDGGSSTGLYFAGQRYLGHLDQAGEPIERSVKSILVIR